MKPYLAYGRGIFAPWVDRRRVYVQKKVGFFHTRIEDR